MTDTSATTRTVRIRLISDAAPPEEYQNRPTEFGLKDKDRRIHPGLALPDGTVQFDLEVPVKRVETSETLRFQGPFALGKSGEPFIGIFWHYADEPVAIRGQKIPLYTLTWKLIDSVTRSDSGILLVRVLPITAKTGTVPVEWTVEESPAGWNPRTI